MAKPNTTVSVEQRSGTFHDDVFFRDSWDEWDKAMKDVVERWEQDQPVESETRSVYRQIRSSNAISDDSQAVSCKEENDKYKMVIDVKDFSPKDISVKTVDDTLIVEGKVERRAGSSVSSEKFVRRFVLPEGVDLNAISSALSRDGVLTISAPKLIKDQNIKDRTVPVKRFESMTSSSSPCGIKPIGTSKSAITSTTRLESPKRHSETILIKVPDRRSSTKNTFANSSVAPVSIAGEKGKEWDKFNQMVEESQKEMEDMLRRHSLKSTSLSPPTSPTGRAPLSSTDCPLSQITSTAFPSSSVVLTTPMSSHDVIRTNNKLIDREEERWDDTPAPGVVRHNRSLNERAVVHGENGSVIGDEKRTEKQSESEGAKEEILSDGTKRRTFTKNYESRQVYRYNSSDAKAV